MISMTGYSRVTRHAGGNTITVEIRATNHRFLEIEQRLPQGLSELEGQIAELVRARIKRGRIDVSVAVHAPKTASRRVVLDEALAENYYQRLMELKGRFGLKGGVTLEQLLALPQVVSVVDDPRQRQALWPAIQQAATAALEQLRSVRRAEGARLVRDIRAQAGAIRTRARTIRARLPKNAAEQKRRLEARLKTLVSGSREMSSAQIREAVAVIRETDIHEELVRLDSHLTHAEQALRGQEALGKKLDFIAQELVREVNTIGSKANDSMIARCVIDMKGAIEKIREQAQNLE